MASIPANPYEVLGVSNHASLIEIKSAYRELAKKHHPDAGGNEEKILLINAAWEILKDADHRKEYDRRINETPFFKKEAKQREVRNTRASVAAKVAQGQAAAADNAIAIWLEQVYLPIDRLIGQIINPFSAELKALSADPYDDYLMDSFCYFIENSKKKMLKIKKIYSSIPTPQSASGFSLSLYHCLSQVEDALNELERYTMGYVDDYLHDGQEMLRTAKQWRLRLKEERVKLIII